MFSKKEKSDTFFLCIFFLGGRWFSKILRNIQGWYLKILTIPYKGKWVVWRRPKTPLPNIKMDPTRKCWRMFTIKQKLNIMAAFFHPIRVVKMFKTR